MLVVSKIVISEWSQLEYNLQHDFWRISTLVGEFVPLRAVVTDGNSFDRPRFGPDIREALLKRHVVFRRWN